MIARGLVPCDRSKVATPCLRSWNLESGSLASILYPPGSLVVLGWRRLAVEVEDTEDAD
jgi:hypothetical protein